MRNNFQLPSSYNKWTWGLLVVGLMAVLYGFIAYAPFSHPAHGEHGIHVGADSTRFWAVLLQNSVYFLLIVNASMFFICVTTLALGGWQVAMRRVPEAISSVVPILGAVTFLILLAIVLGGRTDIYHWLDESLYIEKSPTFDKILKGKHSFLNPASFLGWSFVAIGLWAWLGHKMRALSLKTDNQAPMNLVEAKKWTDTNFTVASFYVVVFGITVAAIMPWLWLMSLDPHWYSTMYSWYTFASTFVSGMALVAIFVIYLKNRGELEYVTEEHLHDIGKFMFAFSVFWAYLWFDQYMLIWYSNQPEETRYFVDRIGTSEKSGPYHGIFFFNLVVNFLCPLLILMRRGSKRNWTVVTFVAVLIIFGHWIDFFQMIMPGVMGEKAHLSFFEFGVPCLFIGLIMWGVGRYFTKNALVQINHPFLKESMIHHT
jgi:hypothetical protein